MAEGSNHDWIGVAQPVRVTPLSPDITEAYAKATDDTNPRYFGEDALAPPMASVIGMIPDSVFALLNQEEFIGRRERLVKLLHGDEDIRWFNPIRATDSLHMQSTVVDIEDKSVGEIMTVETLVNNAEREHLATHLTTLVIRDPKPAEQRVRSERTLRVEPAIRADATGESIAASWTVSADQSVRYAEASRDRNPIHLDDTVAAKAGLRGRILHGLCTMAFAQRVVIDRLADGDPRRLRRLRVRFSKPVYMGDTLTCRLLPVAIADHYRVSVENQDGVAVLRDGVAEVESIS